MDGDIKVHPDDPRVKAAEANIIVLQECLSVVERGAPNSKDRWLATSLLESVHRAYNHLRHGWSEDTTYSAWACRNLLELRIITRYILLSPTERRRFMDDMYIDAADYVRATKLMSAQVFPEMSFQDHDSVLTTLDEKKAERKLTKSKYLQVGALADRVGLLDEYTAMNKICSKMVHPTALSVLWIEKEGQSQINRDVLLLAGCEYLEEIVRTINTFAQTLIRS